MSAYGIFSLSLAKVLPAVMEARAAAEQEYNRLVALYLPSYMAMKNFWGKPRYKNESDAIYSMESYSGPRSKYDVWCAASRLSSLEYFLKNITKENSEVPRTDITAHITLNEYNLIKEYLN